MSRGIRIRARRGVLRRSLVAAIVGMTALALLGIYLVASDLPDPGSGAAKEGRTPAAAAPEPTPAPEPLPRRPVTLFFLDAESGLLVPESREIEMATGTARQARAAIQALLEGPREEGRLPLFPPDTKLLALFIDPHGEAFVDLSGEVMAPTGIEEELLSLASLALALSRNFPEVARMHVLVEGREVPSFRGHLSVEYPLAATDPIYDALVLGHAGAPEAALPEPTLPPPPPAPGPRDDRSPGPEEP